MILPVLADKRVGHDVGISDGAFNTPMAEQFLNVPDARTVFKQVRGRRVPDRMGRYLGFIHFKTAQKRPESLAHAGAGQMPTMRRAAVSGENPSV